MPFVCATFVLICATKTNVCAGLVFLILNILFLTVWRHSPPHVAQIAPNQRSSFVLGLCWFVPLKQTLYIFSFLRYNQNIFGSCDVTLHPSSSKSHKTGVIRLCSICADLCCWNKRQIYFPFLEITKTILGSDVTLHPMPSKSIQTGAVRFARFVLVCAVKRNNNHDLFLNSLTSPRLARPQNLINKKVKFSCCLEILGLVSSKFSLTSYFKLTKLKFQGSIKLKWWDRLFVCYCESKSF